MRLGAYQLFLSTDRPMQVCCSFTVENVDDGTVQRITFVNTMMGRRRSWGGDEDGGGEAPRGELTFPPRRDSSLPLPLLASTIVHTQLITSGSIWRKSEIFLEGCRVPQNVAHCCLLEFSPISCLGSRPPSDIALQCSCGQNSDLVTGLNIRIPRFYPTNAHLQIATSATSRGSNWWWSLPTGRRPLEPICICYNAGSIKTCFLLSWAPMQTVHHWLSEKANKSHFYKDIEYGVFIVP